MAEEAKETQEAPVQPEVTSHGNEQSKVDMTIAEGQAAKPQEGPTAESLGVSEAQFEKYFSKDTGQYNWEAHAKEQEYIEKQKESKEGDKKPEEKTEDAPKWDKELNDETVPEALEAAGLDQQAMIDKIATNGDLDDSDYEALKKIGITEKMANDYIENVFNVNQQHLDSVIDTLGGSEKAARENIDKMKAAGIFTEEQAEAVAKQMANQETGLAFAKGLMAQLNSSNPQPVVLRGENSGAQAADTGYKTQAEMIAAMRDPRYKRDPGYRAEVMEKVKTSSFGDVSKLHTSGL